MSQAPLTPSTLERPSRPKDSDRTTRRPVPFWDRIKLVLLFIGLWLVTVAVVWTDLQALSPALRDVVIQALDQYGWLLVLAGLEIVRQVHYVFEEQSAGYYRFWQQGVFGGVNRRVGRMNEWTRYRVGRVLKLVFFLVLLSMILGSIFHTSKLTALVELPGRLVAAAPFILQLAFAFFFVILQFVGLFWFLSRGGIDVHMPDDIDTRFTDVKGQDAALTQLKETLVFLEDPDAIESRGGYVPGGVLLWGPPGTGKTLMAQAIAGETGKPFVAVEPAAFINMFMGVGALKVKGLYRKLRRLAMRYGGVIVFFDEADSLGSRGTGVATGFEAVAGPWTVAPACNGLAYVSPVSRNAVFASASAGPVPGGHREQVLMGGMMGGGGGGTLQALLSEMSGLTKPRGIGNRIRKLLGMKPKPPPKYRILHIFATNMPDALDPAMLRPGRVDRQYKVGYPQKGGRDATFRYYLALVNHELTDEQIDKLATITPYFSGAAIKDIVNEGLVIAIRDGRETVTYQDVVKAKQLKQHGLPDDHEYIERERHSVAVHEACHAVVAYRLRRHMTIDMATIERRGDIGGFVASIPPEDQFVQWRSEREIDVMTALASLAGERFFFDGDHSMGVGGDMNAATAMTTQAHAYYAMGDTIAARSVTLAALRGAQPLETGADRGLFDTEFGRSVEHSLRELYDRTVELLEANRAEVLAVAHALEVHKTLTGEDIAAIIDGTRGPFIDGASYRDPAFNRELEAYHAAALAAHRAHGEVGSTMPIPVPPPPVEVAAVSTYAANGDAGRERGPKIGPPAEE